MGKRALVFGASGQIGFEVARSLVRSDWLVTGVTREGRSLPTDLISHGVTLADGSNKSRSQVIAETGKTFDAVIDPTAYDVPDALDLIAAQASAGAFVVVSSSSVYADQQGRSLDEASQHGFPELPVGIDENTPTVPPGPKTYSTRKVAMEHALGSAKRPVVILRPCAVYGRYARHLREWWFMRRILNGRTHVPLAYDAESVFHTTSTASIGALVESILRSPRSTIINVADAEPPSVKAIGLAIAAALGSSLTIVGFEGAPRHEVGSSPWSVPRPYVLNTQRMRDLGGTPTSYRETIKDTCDWALKAQALGDPDAIFPLSKMYGHDAFNYRAEDEVLAACHG